MGLGAAKQVPVFIEIHLKLQQYRRVRRQPFVGRLIGPGLEVCAAGDHDLIFGSVVDANDRATGRPVDTNYTRDVNAGGSNFFGDTGAERIIARSTNQAGRRARSAGGNGLVGAFATGDDLIVLPKHGFARTRQMGHRKHQVDIEPAKNHDHRSCLEAACFCA